jgi:glutamate synthase (NADPH/NADH) large chain/glutamate synthase (ferredoxin)
MGGLVHQWHHQQADEVQLKKLLEDHNRWTGSRRARELLDHWSESRGKFIKVFPNEYKRALAERQEQKVLVSTEKAPQAAPRNAAVPAK